MINGLIIGVLIVEILHRTNVFIMTLNDLCKVKNNIQNLKCWCSSGEDSGS